MSNKAKEQTVTRNRARKAKATETQVNVAPKTIVAIASELNLTPKNARRILRSMKANKSVPDYAHEKGNRHFLNAEQESAFRARVMKGRAI